jgi:putative SOS response-associated peptidase YedK
MCGRYTASAAQAVIEDYFGAEFPETHIPSYNASPGQYLPAILDTEPAKIVPVLWGIKPSWGNHPSRLLINARSETVNQRPIFRKSFQKRRCLIVADGFYEWQATKAGKQPFRIALKTRRPFAFAGIWQEVDGESAYVILTTEANRVMRPIHERMPVILERELLLPWLDPDLPEREALEFLGPCPAEAIMVYPVSRAVNSSKNQSPDLIEPLEVGDSGTET